MKEKKKTLQISIGEVGFCGGVSRADHLIQKIRESEAEDLFVLGDLIHNRSYKAHLEKQRIFTLSSPQEAQGKILIIRTHGIPPAEEKLVRSLAKKVYDLTCPLVKTIHEKVEQFSKENYTIFILGDPGHAETKGSMGYAQQDIFPIKTEDDLKMIDFASLKSRKVVLLSQSTFGQDMFSHLSFLLQKEIPQILVENTLCYAPTQRQEEISSLVRSNDMVIIIGGIHSSNTMELFEKAKKDSKNGKVYHIETAEELDHIDLSGITKIGIASGTSTPNFLIQELVQKLENWDEIF